MKLEILSTGDEIRSGAVIDSNSAYIAQQLENAGFFTARHTCVGDDLQTIVSILKEISGRCDVAIVTGGLGPTEDDITAEAAAYAANKKLALDKEAEKQIQRILKKINREMNPSNLKQAMLPEVSTRIDNLFGTAPGFMLAIGKTFFYFLPGVPFEMKKMLPQVIGHIKETLSEDKEITKTVTLKTFGLAESSVNEMLKDLFAKFGTVKIGLRAVFPEIHIKLYGRSEDEKKLSNEIETAKKNIMERIGKYLFSEDESKLEEIVGRMLTEKKATLATAESCTGGLLADRLTNVPGSSDYFLFSGVTYANEAKMKVLGVSPETLEKYGAVSVETVKEMALGAKRVSGADYTISISGIAGPGGGSDEKPVGTVCIAVATPDNPDKPEAKKYTLPFKDRLMNKKLFSTIALERLRIKLTTALTT